MKVCGGLRVFAMFCWHPEGCTARVESRMESVFRRARYEDVRGDLLVIRMWSPSVELKELRKLKEDTRFPLCTDLSL